MKKVVLVSTDFMGINDLMKNEIKDIYEISEVVYPFFDHKFRYKNFLQKLKNFYFKTFKGNKEFKKNLIAIHVENMLIEQLNGYNETFDYALVLNVEYFSNSFLNKIRNKSKLMIAFQWDGLNRTPEIFEKIKYFDKFYAFNPSDVDNKNVFFATNFYFNIIPEFIDNKSSDVYYLGSYLDERTKILNELLNKFEQLKLITNINLFSNKKLIKEKYAGSKINIVNTFLSYYENLEFVNQSNIIIDLKLEVHNGLSFRFFECLFLKKKMITNNKSVVNYDFYHPNNIFILNDNNLEELNNFVNLPYVEIPEKIVSKYYFKNWIKNILENE